MAKSIMHNKADGTCYLCMYFNHDYDRRSYLEEHHALMGTAGRKTAEHYGLKVYLCPEHHRLDRTAAHRNIDTQRYLQRKAQEAFEKKYSRSLWMKVNKKAADFVELFTGFKIKPRPEEQRKAFKQIIDRTLGRTKTIKVIKNIQSELIAMAGDMSGDGDTIGVDELEEVFANCDVAPEKRQSLETVYASELGSGNERLPVSNIADRNGISIKSRDGISIKSKSVMADIAETVTDDGRPALIVYLNDGNIEVNGMEVHIV